MTKNEDMDLARRLVACKNFRLMAGMLDLEKGPHGEPCRIVNTSTDNRHEHEFVDYTWPDENGDCGDMDRLIVSQEYGPHLTFSPDLTDPATLGCLLALVREAWADADFRAVVDVRDLADRDDPSERWEVEALRWSDVTREYQTSFEETFSGSTEAEALVAALEAAP